MKIAWVTPWQRVCGIADYSKALWPAVQAALEKAGMEGVMVSMDECRSPRALLERVQSLNPQVIHFQHEYGIWGGKNPPFYQFPAFVRALSKAENRWQLTATAHTVLSPDYRFPLKGRGVGIPLRAFANFFLINHLRKTWGLRTWGPLDGVAVHSALQIADLPRSPGAVVIPHFVPECGPMAKAVPREELASVRKTILVFGFFTPEKGQDVVIEALSYLPDDVRLVLAGGVRRRQDQGYYDTCLEKMNQLGLSKRIELTGFVESRAMDSLYARANLVVAPFRETTGSGSLAQAFARGVAILASDLPLNREIAEREKDALAFFKAGDARDCAEKIKTILDKETEARRLREGARRYAASCRPALIAEQHVQFWRGLKKG